MHVILQVAAVCVPPLAEGSSVGPTNDCEMGSQRRLRTAACARGGVSQADRQLREPEPTAGLLKIWYCIVDLK